MTPTDLAAFQLRSKQMKTLKDSETAVHDLRYDARMAYLDGRNKRAKELNRLADEMAARLRLETKARHMGANVSPLARALASDL